MAPVLNGNQVQGNTAITVNICPCCLKRTIPGAKLDALETSMYQKAVKAVDDNAKHLSGKMDEGNNRTLGAWTGENAAVDAEKKDIANQAAATKSDARDKIPGSLSKAAQSMIYSTYVGIVVGMGAGVVAGGRALPGLPGMVLGMLVCATIFGTIFAHSALTCAAGMSANLAHAVSYAIPSPLITFATSGESKVEEAKGHVETGAAMVGRAGGA